jgi:hypothetical protein
MLFLASGPASSLEQPRRAPAPRDWQKFPAVAEVDTAEDVYAVGDVHGDYDRLLALLRAGDVIPGSPDHPRDVRWKAGRAVLVCTGDLIDKGDHSLKVVTLFRALADAARCDGGRVLVTMGNHEAEFLADPSGDKKATEFLRDLGGRACGPKRSPPGTTPTASVPTCGACRSRRG